MIKIYCRDCIHFQEGERIPFSYGPPENIREQCMAPQNFKDTHADKKLLPISTPEVINRFNNCTWFKSRESESSSSSSSEHILDMP